MKTKNLIIILISIVITAYLITSCKKDKDELDYSILSAQESSLANNIFDDVFKQVDNALAKTDTELFNTNLSEKSVDTGGCVTITIFPFDTATWPKYITIDFGDTNCLCYDNKNRRGKILVEISDRYRNFGSTYIVTFDNYYVNDYKVEGMKTVVNNGENQAGNLYYSVTVSDAQITKPDGGIIAWNSDRIREWIAGESTLLWIYDDEYLITGSSNGTNSNNEAFTITIITPLNVLVGCPWIRSGIIDIEITNLPTITVDYGDGTCDPNAIAIINGISYPFIMN